MANDLSSMVQEPIAASVNSNGNRSPFVNLHPDNDSGSTDELDFLHGFASLRVSAPVNLGQASVDETVVTCSPVVNLVALVNLGHASDEPDGQSIDLQNQISEPHIQSMITIRDCDPGEGFDHMDSPVCVPTLRMHPPTGGPKPKPKQRQKPINKGKGQKRPRSPEQKAEFSEEQLADPLFSDEEGCEYMAPVKKDSFIFMIKTPWSIMQRKLPSKVKERLKEDTSIEISNEFAKDGLGLGKRWDHVLATEPKGSMYLSDSCGYMHMHWRVPSLPESFLTTDEMTKLMTEVAGEIRDQDMHEMCCFYALCDLMSSTAVLHGQMDEYQPLSQMFVCQNADPEEYVARRKKKEAHFCYQCAFYTALKFAKESETGIPLANKNEMSDQFSCTVKREIEAGEKTFKIKDVYHYETLKEALHRLKTHTVSASLLCFDGWVKPGLYTGPGRCKTLAGTHQVLMLACVQYEGKMAIKCKSSNGLDVGNDGYLYVSPEVMFIEVASARKKNNESTCRIKPSHLLFDFYSMAWFKKSSDFGDMALSAKKR